MKVTEKEKNVKNLKTFNIRKWLKSKSRQKLSLLKVVF